MKNASKLALSTLALVVMFTFGGSTGAQAGTCNCSDEGVGGGTSIFVSNQRIEKRNCTNGNVLNWLLSFPDVSISERAICTYSD